MALAITQEIKLLARHSAVYSLGTFMQRIVALLLLPVYTRYLTPHDYGVKELVGLSTDVISILLATAISGAFFRFYFNYDNENDRNEVFSTALLSIAVVGLVAVGLLCLFTSQMAGLILDDAGLYYFFYISFASLWFRSLNNIGFSFLKANKRSIMFISLSLCRMVMAIGLNIYFVCVMQIGVLGILISTLLTSVVMALGFTLPLLLRVKLRFSRSKVVEMLRYGLPLIPSQFGAFIVHLSDRFFIKEFVSIADAGLYSLGYRFGTLPGTFISDPFNQIFQPRRLEVYKQEGSEYVFGRIFTYFLLLIFFAGLLIAVLTRDVLMVMADAEFWSAYRIVPLIVLANTVFTFHYHLNIGIMIAKKTKYLAYINFSNGALVLVLNFLLIPRFGIWGAAWATLFAFIYKATLTYYFSSRFFKVHFELLRICKLVAIAGAVYAVSQLIALESAWLSFLVKALVVVTLYPLGLLGGCFFESGEKEKIRMIIKNRSLSGVL